ncbi:MULTISPECIES: hypothetical protein [unclassified Mesorhizobium]|jgi:hypothetical protein|uniref:hypothetical protein n=1 Tax=unclassified Mesorhizobium TaxID=325217 RepID=UPI0033378A1F
MNIAIVTARAGSKSIIDNSILPLRGKPMVHISHPRRPRRDLDSVTAVWEAANDHPYRALQINSAGLIEAFGGARKI